MQTYGQKDFFTRLLDEYKREYQLKDDVLITSIGIARVDNKNYYPSLVDYCGINKKTKTHTYTNFRISSDDRYDFQNDISNIAPVKLYDERIFEKNADFIKILDRYKEYFIDKKDNISLNYANIVYYSGKPIGSKKIKKVLEKEIDLLGVHRFSGKLNYLKYVNNRFQFTEKNALKPVNSCLIIVVNCSISIENQKENLNEYNFIIADDV